VSDPILLLLTVLMAALLVLGGIAAVLPPKLRHAAGFIASMAAGLGGLMALIYLLFEPAPDQIVLPLGLPSGAITLALDPLSGFFLLLVCIAATACIAFAAETAAFDQPGTLAGVIISLGGLFLALLAADGAGLALGLAIGGGALWASGESTSARAPFLGAVVLAAICCVAAIAVLAAPDLPVPFSALRITTADAAYAWVAPLLALLGPGALLGLIPFHAWLVPAHSAAPPRVGAMISGALLPVALYAMARLTIDLGGRAPSVWWGVPFLILGTATTLLGAWRSGLAGELDAALASFSHRQSGLAVTALGLALIGKAADLPAVTAVSLAAMLLLAAIQAMCMTLTLLCAGAVRHGAGSRRLDRLGGLIHRMPVTGWTLLAGLFGMSLCPPAAGFAAFWLVFQAIVAAPRLPDIGAQAAAVALLMALGGSGILAMVSAVRLFGICFLGRPRSPRGAAADDAPRQAWPALLGLAVVAACLGVVPGVPLTLLGLPTIRLIADTDAGPHTGPLTLGATIGAAGYAPVFLVLLLAAITGGLLWFARRGGAQPRPASVWADGFAASPPWLPFGDPLTQTTSDGFVPVPPALPAVPWPGVPRWRWRRRFGIWAALAAAVLLIAWLGAA
jgi:hydrogenase-4 component B